MYILSFFFFSPSMYKYQEYNRYRIKYVIKLSNILSIVKAT